MTLGLLTVFVIGKLVVVGGRVPGLTVWNAIAYFRQDLLAALLCGALFAWMRRTRACRPLVWTIYGAVVGYAALNIPIARTLFTPLTWPMLRAARGPLSDSIWLHLTWTNVGLIGLTISMGIAVPLFAARVNIADTARHALPRVGLAAAAIIVAIGPFASAQVDTFGLDRNVLSALVMSALPHVTAHNTVSDWRQPPFATAHTEPLSALRGIARGRNVVLVSLESTAAQYLALYGGNQNVTPNLSALARESIVFDDAYAVYPESIKGLFSVLCSTFPAFDSTPDMYENRPCRALPAVLAEHGYRTGLFHSGHFDYLGMASVIRNRGYQQLEDAADIGGDHESSFGVDEPSTVGRMLSWIDAVPPGDPFFLTYLPIAGHHPYETPERGPFPDRDQAGRYLNALRYGDAALGMLAEGLRNRGLAERTLWIVFGDHGEAFGQHEGNFGHTFFLYEENVRVPLIIVAPAALRDQQRFRNVVSLVDVAPTIFALLDIPAPAAYQGQSILTAPPSMALFFTDYSLGLVGLRDGRWKFVYEIDSDRSKLFDVERDAKEQQNVAASHPVRVRWYRDHLLAWSAAQKGRLQASRY